MYNATPYHNSVFIYSIRVIIINFLQIQCKDSESSLTDSPGERPLDRVDGLVQVVAVQTKTGFQAEGVAGTQTCGLHLRVLK